MIRIKFGRFDEQAAVQNFMRLRVLSRDFRNSHSQRPKNLHGIRNRRCLLERERLPAPTAPYTASRRLIFVWGGERDPLMRGKIPAKFSAKPAHPPITPPAKKCRPSQRKLRRPAVPPRTKPTLPSLRIPQGRIFPHLHRPGRGNACPLFLPFQSPHSHEKRDCNGKVRPW